MAEIRHVNAGADRDLLLQAAALVIGRKFASKDLLQRRVRVGSVKAGRLLVLLEDAGVIAPARGSGSRTVLVHAAAKDAVLALLAGEDPHA